PMPIVTLPFDQDLARGTQRAMVSGYVPGPMPGEATYAVGVPVMVDGEVGYILSFTVPLSRLQGILSREVVPGWTTGISDRSGIVLA
ncbi:histidine kinase, partial [Escherichia coli]|nr:histidine kinase [Escherichia coli]